MRDTLKELKLEAYKLDNALIKLAHLVNEAADLIEQQSAENAALKAAYKPAVTLQSGDQHSKLSGSGFWFHLKDSITLGDLPSGTVLYIRETKP